MTVKELYSLNRNNEIYTAKKFGKKGKLTEIYLELYLEDGEQNKIYTLAFGRLEELYADSKKVYEKLWEREIKSFYIETDPFDSSVVKMRIQI